MQFPKLPFGDARPGRIAQTRDHVERSPDKLLASVTDRGKIYPINQDDIRVRKTAIDSGQVVIMVAADGVSSGQHADVASTAAVTAASDFLLTNLSLGGDPREAMRQAILAADTSVRAISYEDKRRNANPPGTTIVAAVAIRKRLIIGWVGDSRAYLIDKSGATLLTHDHSWVNAMVDSGMMTPEQAAGAREAHQITRCIGPLHSRETPGIAEPGIVAYDLPTPAIVLLCSDGLWNYIPSPTHLASMLQIGPDAPDAITQARILINFALAQGGKDNISVALMIR